MLTGRPAADERDSYIGPAIVRGHNSSILRRNCLKVAREIGVICGINWAMCYRGACRIST
jgi:hypothetical protein